MVDEGYEDYENKCKRIRKENAVHLATFEKSLIDAGLSSKTVHKHVQNADFYINVYLLGYDACPMSEGVTLIGLFLGDWFIRKCMWSTPSTIRQNATSLKKFYKCMLDEGNIEPSDYGLLLRTIKDEKDQWIKECEAFNSGSDDRFW